MQQEDGSINPCHSDAIFEPKSGSILLMKAFFFEADTTTSVTIANKNQTKTKQLAQKMSFSKKMIKKYVLTNSSGFKNTSVLLLINNYAYLCFL